MLAALPLIAARLTFSVLPTRGATPGILVDRTTDYFVVIDAPSFLEVETDLCPESADYWCPAPPFMDSMLWLYNAAGEQLAVNDDDPRANGLSWHSYIGIELNPGVYRLRAGRFFCRSGGCSWPEEPFPAGGAYLLISNTALVLDPTPPQGSPPPVPSELPTPEPTPTPSVSPSSEPTPEPTPEATPTPTPTPTPEPSPTPTPTPTPEPSQTPVPTVVPSQSVLPTSTPVPTVFPSPESTPTLTPSPTPVESVTPVPSVEPVPSVTPSPEPPPAEAAIEAIGAVAEAAAEAVGEAVTALTTLGNDLSPAEKEQAAPVAVAVVISQVASAAVAAAASAASSGGTGSAGGTGRKGKTK
jgi:hypothetical protein